MKKLTLAATKRVTGGILPLVLVAVNAVAWGRVAYVLRNWK